MKPSLYRTQFLALLLFFQSYSASAQTQQNLPAFQGRWTLNQKESFSGSNNVYEEYTITITENGAEIKIETRISSNGKSTVFERVYFTDGRGEENITSIGNLKDIPVKSETNRRGNSIKTRYEYGLRKIKEKQRGFFRGTFEYILKKSGSRMTFIHAHQSDFPDARSTFGQPSSSSGVTRWIFDRLP